MPRQSRYMSIYLLYLMVWAVGATYAQMTALDRPTASAVVIAAVGFLGLLPIWALRRSSRDLIIGVVVYSTFLGGMDAIRRLTMYRFQRAYAELRPGMDAADIESVFRRRFPDRPVTIALTRTGGYIGLGPVLPGCAGHKVGVYMKNGRIESKLYLPD